MAILILVLLGTIRLSLPTSEQGFPPTPCHILIYKALGNSAGTYSYCTETSCLEGDSPPFLRLAISLSCPTSTREIGGKVRFKISWL